YILVANMLSRRIYAQYQERTEKALSDEKIAKPVPLVITIEEAHKFLNPEVAGKTIFGTIAREMRKYNVSLLIIDQRPSGIDEEVMSQVGTKITYLLDNERDVDSVLAGVSGKSALKSVLARLAPRQQALVFGHAVPMPVAFQPREYGSAQSYKDFADERAGTPAPKDIEDLFK
ncbi:MAG: ATP-binding protein, partial [Dehalococcoidales bacterium]|nr:ATP-binding protein [Dehalococcoidales bacterium]